MQSLRTFRIEFDRPGATYAPGELITGNVIVDLIREKSVTALKLSVKGEANVNWEIRTSNDSINDSQENLTRIDHLRANEQYFKLTHYLFANTTGDDDLRMPAGFHKYPFKFSLPYNIPCSLEHVNGHIRYTTKAIIERPWTFDHECKIAFTVVASYDLNAYSQQCLGVDYEANENFYNFCCFNIGTIKTRIKIPTTGFVPGQSIDTIINLNNNSSVNVSKICVKLERSLEFHAKIPYAWTKKNKSVVKSDENMGPFDQYVDLVSRLQIPPIPPSQLKYCSIIDQKYTLCITIHVSGLHFNITETFPILIGTIPLRSIISSVPYTQTIQPTVPMMRYNDPPPPMLMSPDYGDIGLANIPYPGFIGFVPADQPSTSVNQWDMPPPSYEECMQRADNIKDHDESNYVHGAYESFAPRYPVFNFPTPCKKKA